jgi:predicted DNA-binding protein YlxM (UPF0122 family)
MQEKVFEIGMLYDFYGKLLTAKQSEFIELYCESNYTLSEIAENMGISRQAVHDTIKKVEIILHEYEKNLGLIEKFAANQNEIEAIDSLIEKIIAENKGNDIIKSEIEKIKSHMGNINL